MLVNKINIEGLCNEEEMKKISLENVNVFNYNTDFNIETQYGVKDIIEVSFHTEIPKAKTIEFKNTNLTTITVLTDFKILTTENKDSNTLSIMERKVYFNYSFERKNKKYIKDYENITVNIIDCYFKLVDNYKIVGTLTYLFKEKEEDLKIPKVNNNEKSSYRLIDITAEFA